MRSDASTQLEAVHAWHEPIANNYVCATIVEDRERVLAVVGTCRRMAEVLYNVDNKRSNVRVILCNQDFNQGPPRPQGRVQRVCHRHFSITTPHPGPLPKGEGDNAYKC